MTSSITSRSTHSPSTPPERRAAIVVGIDIAAQGSRTSICELTWHAGRASAEFGTGTDPAVLAALRGAVRVAVDCPFGWPDSFVQAVTAHRTKRWPAADDAEGDDLLFRRTELAIRRDWGARPQRVTGSLMGQVTVRSARLLGAHERASGTSCVRDGSGPIVEVYPGIAARRWELYAGSYKGTDAHQVRARERMARMVLSRSRVRPHLNNDMEASVADLLSDARADRLDALLAAPVATCAAERLVEPIPPDEAAHAAIEGWIQIPTADLDSVGREPRPLIPSCSTSKTAEPPRASPSWSTPVGAPRPTTGSTASSPSTASLARPVATPTEHRLFVGTPVGQAVPGAVGKVMSTVDQATTPALNGGAQ